MKITQFLFLKFAYLPNLIFIYRFLAEQQIYFSLASPVNLIKEYLWGVLSIQSVRCEFESCSWRGVLDTTLCDKICQ
jgi:hypothetical protein